MSAEAPLSVRPRARHRTCCPCASCAGSLAALSSLSRQTAGTMPPSWLARAVRLAKRAGYLGRQRAAKRQGFAWLRVLLACVAPKAQKVVDALLELDVRIACEASGQAALLRCQPEALQQMILRPRRVLARPDWLREFLLTIWIGAHVGAHAEARGAHNECAWRGAQAACNKNALHLQGGANSLAAVWSSS